METFGQKNVADSKSFPRFGDKVKFPADDSKHKRHPHTKEIAQRIIKKIQIHLIHYISQIQIINKIN